MQWNFLRHWRQRGAIITFTAFLLPLLMACTGLAIDMGNLMSYKAKLQNVADAAALAGVARFGGTQFDTVSYRLTKIPSDISDDGSFTLTMDETEYKMVEDTSTSIPDSEAEVYVDSNTRIGQKLSLMELKQEDANTTQMWASKDTNGNVNAVCYLVRLHDTIPTYFIRLFGIESLTPEAVAVAMAYISTTTEEKKIDEFIPEVAKNIAETIPNYYWQSIVGRGFTVTNTAPEIMDFDIRTTGFGYRKSAYFTDTWQKYIKDITKEEDFVEGDQIITYKDRDPIGDPQKVNNEWVISYDGSANASLVDSLCAEPIYADADADANSLSSLKKLVYTLNSDLIQNKGSDGEITGLFLDRPAIGDSQTVRATVLNITSDVLSKNETTPLYMRFESEPIRFGSWSTFVQPITVNVNGYQKKPLIIAYDGPDPNRTLKDVPKTDVKKPGSAWNNDTRILSTERLNSAKLSAPYTVNLNADFNGVIYAPFSEITIKGNGKINGFIMAARIIDLGAGATRTKLTSSEVSLPVWGAKHTGGDTFSYTVTYIKGNYSIVYDSLTYYTNSIVYKE
ncbi:MAG: Tad domain-containing protein [Selenomonadaceae bacterium]|nr:Tad domain-containing protein [Selenomonadaceae bacterium]